MAWLYIVFAEPSVQSAVLWYDSAHFIYNLGFIFEYCYEIH